ncbi:hypothetical protein TIFTF001_043389 [Ficus carica]|uniref:Uncharacterized protein n=1 Tax=Ficus carica TaxID=3494 RepID=A0AA87ZBV7_FICCA|nr:hypothetical protein TIFTF001_043389 [Ficus carica]
MGKQSMEPAAIVPMVIGSIFVSYMILYCVRSYGSDKKTTCGARDGGMVILAGAGAGLATQPWLAA